MKSQIARCSSTACALGRLCLGAFLGFSFLASLAELFCHLFPPSEQVEYQGESSSRAGPFVRDDELGLRYRSWEAFEEENGPVLDSLELPAQTPEPRPVWAFFGNSFVQARGMLGDTAREIVDRRIFFLGRNELLNVRVAQVELLLQHGFRPERIFMVLMPLDVAALGRQPLLTFQITSQGALGYRPRMPRGPAGWAVEHLALAKLAWFRASLHYGNPRFRAQSLDREIDASLLSDLRRVFGRLAAAAGQAGVPVTAVLIPNYEQIMSGAPTGFQRDLGALLKLLELDVFDAMEVFEHQSEPSRLFLADKHFTPAGNRLLLSGILEHLRQVRPGIEYIRVSPFR